MGADPRGPIGCPRPADRGPGRLSTGADAARAWRRRRMWPERCAMPSHRQRLQHPEPLRHARSERRQPRRVVGTSRPGINSIPHRARRPCRAHQVIGTSGKCGGSVVADGSSMTRHTERTATSFDNQDFVGYRHAILPPFVTATPPRSRSGAIDADLRNPAIAVRPIAILRRRRRCLGPPNPRGRPRFFSGPIAHRVIPMIGHALA